MISVAEGWQAGPAEVDKGARWEPAELGEVIPEPVGKARLTRGRTETGWSQASAP